MTDVSQEHRLGSVSGFSSFLRCHQLAVAVFQLSHIVSDGEEQPGLGIGLRRPTKTLVGAV